MELKRCRGLIKFQSRRLLIVPYGIETQRIVIGQAKTVILLIVPYGIETKTTHISLRPTRTFNRTLWN